MENRNTAPELILLVGIPACGKSTAAREYAEKGYTVLSSDRERAALTDKLPADKKERARLNSRVFELMKKRAKRLLAEGVSVVIDATDLARKKRMAFLSFIDKIPSRKRCILFVVSPQVCIARNKNRPEGERVPDEDMDRMFRSFEIPLKNEGFDEMSLVSGEEKYEFPFDLTKGFSQDNPHHTLTLDEHMKAAEDYCAEHGFPDEVKEAAKYHDIGKLYTKEFKNYKGESSEHAHFYGHENFGAYLYLCEKLCGKNLSEEERRRVFYVALLINYHMRSLLAWCGSANAKERDKLMLGDKMIADIEMLNKADGAAH